jgi:hypothetical protein
MTGYARVFELEAEERDRVREAIHDWIREDAGVTIKMAMDREQVDKLVKRICG